MVTPDNLEPNPKNPVIAAFFRNIAYADQLGSGTRNLFKYSKFYSGHDPELIEGDVFKIIVPLDDTHVPEVMDEDGQMVKYNSISTQAYAETTQDSGEFTQGQGKTNQTGEMVTQDQGKTTQAVSTNIIGDKTDIRSNILDLMSKKPSISQSQIAVELNLSVNVIKYHVRKLRVEQKIIRVGSSQKGYWSIF